VNADHHEPRLLCSVGLLVLLPRSLLFARSRQLPRDSLLPRLLAA